MYITYQDILEDIEEITSKYINKRNCETESRIRGEIKKKLEKINSKYEVKMYMENSTVYIDIGKYSNVKLFDIKIDVEAEYVKNIKVQYFIEDANYRRKPILAYEYILNLIELDNKLDENYKTINRLCKENTKMVDERNKTIKELYRVSF